jgi:hypothetical protein
LKRQYEADLKSRGAREAFIDTAGGVMPTGAGPTHWYEHLDTAKSRLWLVADPSDGKMSGFRAQERAGTSGPRGRPGR